jgi:hypothetical protein
MRTAALSFTIFAIVSAALALEGPAASQSPARSPAPSETGLRPEAIYLRATHAMKDAPEPDYVTFHEDVTARNMRLTCGSDGTSLELKHGDAAAAYLVYFRTRDEVAVSEDARSQKRCSGALLHPTGNEIATLGAAPSATPSASPSPSSDGPQLIAALRVESARFYRIALVDRETFEGHPVYRLALTAYRDPTEHPLTGMLVDEGSFLVRQASGEAAAHFVVASGRFAGTITFDQSGPYWLARDETFDIAAQAIFVHAHCKVSVHATDFQFPTAIADVFPSPSPSPSPRTTKR